MPAKYVIHTNPVPHRFEPLSKSGVIAWEEGCLKCAVCVKKQCIYNVYAERDLDAHQMIDSIDNQCMNCFRCVQNCPKELIHKSASPEHASIGDAHWTPDIIARLWYQAETGKIPVSGAGYPGPFSGIGFDSMWTDMSEIVRPTRDGIHGREYISTSVDLGRTPEYLEFAPTGKLGGDIPALVDIPLPMIMRVPPFGSLSEKTIQGWAMAAERLGTLLALPAASIGDEMAPFQPHLLPIVGPEERLPDGPGAGPRIVEVPWQEKWRQEMDRVHGHYPNALISLAIPMSEDAMERILPAVSEGIAIIHLMGSYRGRAADDDGRPLKEGIRSIHRALVEEGIRDHITLLASGGLSMAEHVAKSIVCGADAVMVDFPVLIALECRMCQRCEQGLTCPVEIENADASWVTPRTINLVGAWHNQLLEVMGAMGIRDIRRLRGEVGRAIFFEETDRSVFGSLGEFKEGCELE